MGGDQGDMTTKCQVRLWIRPWNHKKIYLNTDNILVSSIFPMSVPQF